MTLNKLFLASLLGCLAFSGVACGGGGVDAEDLGEAFQGTVSDPSGSLIADATVYLIPAADVAGLPDLTSANMRSIDNGDGTYTMPVSTDFDEPLEDLVRLNGASFLQADTGADGRFVISVVPEGRYFVYVEPSDANHLPGGSLCRDSLKESGLRGMDLEISVSGVTGTDAHYMGADRCLECHPDHSGTKSLAHSLGFKVPNEVSDLQDLSDFPEFDMSFDYFISGADYTVGTPVYYYSPDSSKGMDDFETSASSQGADNVVILWLWTDEATGIPNITFENVVTPADPMNFHTHEVRLTYGGAVNKQRYMLEWEDYAADGSLASGGNGLKGLYPTLQFQGFTVDQAGDKATGYEGSDDGNRQVWRDYHMDYYWNDVDNTFMVPGSVDGKAHNISVKCMGCHATGWNISGPDPITGEVLSSSIASYNGEYDLDGNGTLDILNTGCESCHGPGSNHVAAQGPGGSKNGAFIVSPEDLTPSREIMLCNRCHNRIAGQGEHFGAGSGDHPVNAANEWPEAGMGLAEFLTDYAADGIKAPKSTKNWGDDIHAKSHHQQAPDFLKSAHYRNEYHLVTCASCHDLHGGTGFKRALTADPDVVDSALCTTCHNTYLSGGDTSGHTLAMVGYDHGVAHGANASCVDCHMARMAKTGAGVEGKVTMDGTYYTNDITSHIFDVPTKATLTGVAPDSAMPIPYTNICATCHNVEDFYAE